MTERWKYQIKVGLFWGIFMSLIAIFTSEKKITEEFQDVKTYWRLVLDLIVGIFFMGYIFWKGRDPKNHSWSTVFKRNKREK